MHKLKLKMSEDQIILERFINSLEGEVISIIPNVTYVPILLASKIDFLFIVEKVENE